MISLKYKSLLYFKDQNREYVITKCLDLSDKFLVIIIETQNSNIIKNSKEEKLDFFGKTKEVEFWSNEELQKFFEKKANEGIVKIDEEDLITELFLSNI